MSPALCTRSRPENIKDLSLAQAITSEVIHNIMKYKPIILTLTKNGVSNANKKPYVEI